MLETLDYIIRIGSTPTILYFDLYLYSAYAAQYVYIYTNTVNFSRFRSRYHLRLLTESAHCEFLVHKLILLYIYIYIYSSSSFDPLCPVQSDKESDKAQSSPKNPTPYCCYYGGVRIRSGIALSCRILI